MSCSDTNFQYYCSRLQRSVYFNYYDLLQINCDATDEDIKKAYRTLARKYHPDRCISESSKEMSVEKFKFISDAYTNLIDPIKRSAYNSFLLQMTLRQKLKSCDIQDVSSMLRSCQQQDLIPLLVQYFNQQQSQQSYQQNYQQTYKQDEDHIPLNKDADQQKTNINNTVSCDNLDNISEETDGQQEQQHQQYPINSNTSTSIFTPTETAFYEKFPFLRPSHYQPSNSSPVTDLNNQTNDNLPKPPCSSSSKHQSDDSAETVVRTPLTKAHIIHLQKSSKDRKLIDRIRSKKSIFSSIPIIKKSISKHN